ncbi:MAG TPA: DUF4097 family beta strand repeat-containing protein [Candidatus Udaeobacter sp.]|jgi:hypothetical protein|nr:DUF4097 family beta strand repeat-containing protein [Candidatus Udaeobacter sp.]
MKTHSISKLGIAITLVALLHAPSLAKDSDEWKESGTPDFEWSGALKTGQTVEIKGINGSIIAGSTSGNQVEIRAWKHARHSDPTSVKIELIPHAGGLTVCSVYPTPFGSAPNRCEPGEGGHMNTRNNDVEVRYVVRVPATVGFVARNVNGSVTAIGLSGPTEANTVNGSVTVATAGRAEAETVNGSIHASLGVHRWTDPIEFKTVNGRIELSVPPDLDAEVDASTVNGGIESDLPMTLTGKIGRTHLHGTINKGGSPLRLETVNGGIHITSGT